MNVLRLIKAESYKRGLALSIVFNILAKGALFLLTICIASYFGSNIKTDIYFFVYSSMILLSGFINSIDVQVLVPESMRLRESEGNIAATAFLNYFFRVYVLIGILFIAMMFFYGTAIFGLFSKFPVGTIISYRDYFILGSFYFLLQVLTTYMNNILTSLKFFTIPMIISGINSCIVIAGMVLLHKKFDVLSVFWGGIAAYTINIIFLLWVMKKMANWNFFTGSLALQKKVWTNILYAEMGQLATLASSFFPLFLLSGFGQGVISVMNYGKNIADIPNSLLTAQLANVSGIKLNEQFAKKDMTGMNETFTRASASLVFILVPLGFFLFVFARPIIQLFYERGNFSEMSVIEASRFLQLLAVTGFCIGINAMVTRIFIAQQAIRQAFFYQLALNTLSIVAIWLFTKKYGAYGYPYGIIIMNLLNFILLYFVCRAYTKQINYFRILKYTGMIILINFPIAALLYFIAPFIHSGLLIELIICFVMYLAILLIVNQIFKINEGMGFKLIKGNFINN